MGFELEQFMKDSPEIRGSEMDEELFQLEKRFYEVFGHSVPREMLPPSVSKDNIKEALKKCLESGDDDLDVELGVPTNMEVYY